MLKRILKKVKKIDFVSNNRINSLFTGNYRSVFYGRGIEFADLRKYELGDDARDIEWNSSNRSGEVMIKQYNETRDNTLFFVFDMSPAMRFHSGKQKKYEMLLETFAILAFEAVRNGDKVGAIWSGGAQQKIFKVKKGKRNVLKILVETITAYERDVNLQKNKTQNINQDFRLLMNLLKHSAVIFWLSGSLPEYLSPEFKKMIKTIKMRYDFIPIIFSDRQEVDLPRLGEVEFLDVYSGQYQTVVITEQVAKLFKAEYQSRKKTFLNFFRKYRMESIFINEPESIFKNLLIFFKKRQRHIV